MRIGFRRLRPGKPVVRFKDGWSADLIGKERSKSSINCWNISWRRGRTTGIARNVHESKISTIRNSEFKGSPNYDVWDIDTDREGSNECKITETKQKIHELESELTEIKEKQQIDYKTLTLEDVEFSDRIQGKQPTIIERKETAPLIYQQLLQSPKEEKKKPEAKQNE